MLHNRRRGKAEELPEPGVGPSHERYQIQVHLRGVPRRFLHVPGLDD
jgi:hypothetical protein